MEIKTYPVINTEARVYQLAYYADRPDGPPSDKIDPRVCEVVKLLPGLNYVDEDTLVKVRFADLDTQGRLRMADPSDLEVFRAIELAGVSSRPALRRWRDTETRAEVRKAIDAALARPARARERV